MGVGVRPYRAPRSAEAGGGPAPGGAASYSSRA